MVAHLQAVRLGTAPGGSDPTVMLTAPAPEGPAGGGAAMGTGMGARSGNKAKTGIFSPGFDTSAALGLPRGRERGPCSAGASPARPR